MFSITKYQIFDIYLHKVYTTIIMKQFVPVPLITPNGGRNEGPYGWLFFWVVLTLFLIVVAPFLAPITGLIALIILVRRLIIDFDINPTTLVILFLVVLLTILKIAV